MTTRTLISKNIITDDKGIEYYEYIYEVTKTDTNQTKTVIVRNKLDKKYPNKYSDENLNEVLRSIQNYFATKNLELKNFQKRIVLDKELKSIVQYVYKETQIKLTQNQTRKLIQSKLL